VDDCCWITHDTHTGMVLAGETCLECRSRASGHLKSLLTNEHLQLSLSLSASAAEPEPEPRPESHA